MTIDFATYLEEQLNSNPQYTSKTKQTHESYCGIVKREYPKWEGWKVIKEEKAKGISAHNISNEKLEILVSNFYYIKYIELTYENNI